MVPPRFASLPASLVQYIAGWLGPAEWAVLAATERRCRELVRGSETFWREMAARDHRVLTAHEVEILVEARHQALPLPLAHTWPLTPQCMAPAHERVVCGPMADFTQHIVALQPLEYQVPPCFWPELALLAAPPPPSSKPDCLLLSIPRKTAWHISDDWRRLARSRFRETLNGASVQAVALAVGVLPARAAYVAWHASCRSRPVLAETQLRALASCRRVERAMVWLTATHALALLAFAALLGCKLNALTDQALACVDVGWWSVFAPLLAASLLALAVALGSEAWARLRWTWQCGGGNERRRRRRRSEGGKQWGCAAVDEAEQRRRVWVALTTRRLEDLRGALIWPTVALVTALVVPAVLEDGQLLSLLLGVGLLNTLALFKPLRGPTVSFPTPIFAILRSCSAFLGMLWVVGNLGHPGLLPWAVVLLPLEFAWAVDVAWSCCGHLDRGGMVRAPVLLCLFTFANWQLYWASDARDPSKLLNFLWPLALLAMMALPVYRGLLADRAARLKHLMRRPMRRILPLRCPPHALAAVGPAQRAALDAI